MRPFLTILMNSACIILEFKGILSRLFNTSVRCSPSSSTIRVSPFKDFEMSQHPTPAEDASTSSLPPGTAQLVDLDGTMATKHADGKGVRDIVLIPRPSDDPEDPLNWSFRRKLLSTSCIVVYTVLLALPSSAVYSVVTPIREATGLTLTDLNNGTGIMVRLIGFGRQKLSNEI